MRIVYQTNPASQIVVVDTLVGGLVYLHASPMHPEKECIDLLYVRDNQVGIIHGVPTAGRAAPPALPAGARPLAHIHRPRGQVEVYNFHITERSHNG